MAKRAITEGECWKWTGAHSSDGYGTIIRRHRQLTVHRVAYSLLIGPIPDGLQVLHRCDNPPCFNPGHLFLGTHAENMADMKAKGRTRNNPRRGESNPCARLTEADVRTIRTLKMGGQTLDAIAARFGVHRMTVQGVVKGWHWKHVV